METMNYNGYEFTYKKHEQEEINKNECVDVYSDITFVKGDDLFPVGYKIGQISIIKYIKFENEDGFEHDLTELRKNYMIHQ